MIDKILITKNLQQKKINAALTRKNDTILYMVH